MVKYRNLAVLVLVAVLAGWALYSNLGAKDEETLASLEEDAKPGYLAPSFALNALDGVSYQVGGPREKPLFLNFWASWCGPCAEEAPALALLYDKYKDKLDMYAVNLTRNDDMEAVKAFVEQYGYHFPVLLDEKLVATKLYRVQVIPTSFLIDRNGKIVDVFNLLEPAELEKKIRKLIEE